MQAMSRGWNPVPGHTCLAFLLLTTSGCGGKRTDSGAPTTTTTSETTETTTSTVTTATTTSTTTTTWPTGVPLTIAGSYRDEHDSSHEITDTRWEEGITGVYLNGFSITRFDNGSGALIAQNDPSNTFDASKWSRFDWHYDAANDLYFCRTVHGANTEAIALGTPAADASDLTAGCGGFAWTLLTP